MTQAGKITWPNTGTLRVNFLGDSVGYRGSFASTLENSWRYLMRARLESVGPVAYGSYDHTHNANGNTVFTSVSNVSGGEDLTFVMLGTNNVREAQEYNAFSSDCASALDRVRAAAPRSLGRAIALEHLPMGDRLASALADRHAVAGVGVTADRPVDGAAWPVGRAPDEGQIAAFERSAAAAMAGELRRQRAVRTIVLRHHH